MSDTVHMMADPFNFRKRVKMMTRCIDQFHKPRECNEACIETEKIANELKKLVTSLDG